MIGQALLVLLSHWQRRPGQLVTLVLGLALATALWTSVQAINAEARASYAQASASMGGGSTWRFEAREGGLIPLSAFAALRRAGWAATPLIEGEIDTPEGPVRLLGIEPVTAAETAPAAAAPAAAAEGTLRPGFVAGDGVLLAAPETALKLRAQPDLPPVEVSGRVGRDTALTDIATAARLLQTGGAVTAILVDPTAREGLVPIETAAPLLIRVDAATGGELSRLTASFHLNLTAFGFLCFAVGFLIALAAVGLAFEQRRGSLRTLRALGTPLRVVILALFAEAALLALAAGLAGVILGGLIAAALLPDVAATLSGLYGATTPGGLSLRPSWALSGLGIAFLGALGAMAGAAREAARMPLLAAAKPRAWAMAQSGSMGRRAGAGVALLLSGALLPLLADGLLAGFALLAALMAGAALLLPPALHLLLARAQGPARGPVTEWFLADTRQQLPGLSLALTALMLALAANIGVGTMVSSFRLTFEGWLDQRLFADLYVAAENEEQALALSSFLEGEAEAVLPVISVNRDIAGRPGEVFGIVDDEGYRRSWPLIAAQPLAWDLLAQGEGVLVNEQTFRAEGLKLGAPVAIEGAPTLPLVGVYSDYGNPRAQAMVSLSVLEAMAPAPLAPLRFGVRTAEPEALAMALRERFGLSDDAVVDQARIKAFSLSVFERTFAVTGALNVLTLGVAGFAMFANLVTLSAMRLPQLAPLWALGLPRRRLARIELFRAALLGALTFFLALPAGLVLAFALLAVVNVEAFGWRLPMHVFPGDWLRLFLLSLLAASLAAALPAWALSKRPPRDFLQIFAQER